MGGQSLRGRPMTTRWRLAGIAMLAAGALLAMAVFCGLRAGEDLRQALVQASDQHLVSKLQHSAQSRLTIGLTVDQLETLQPLIEREKASVPAILGIDLYALDGRLLYSTDRSAIGLQVAPAWLEPLARPGVWQLEGPSERTVGMRVEDDLGQPALGVAVTLAKPLAPTALSAWVSLQPSSDRQSQAALLLACLLLTGAAVAGIATKGSNPWRGLADALREAAPAAGPAAPATQLAHEAGNRHQAWQRAEREIDEGLAALRALDDAS